jgi:hypothetical protein
MKKLRANCDNDKACGPCSGKKHGHELKGNLLASEISSTTYEDELYLIVPVVMAKNGIVMNGSLTDIAEFIPEAWNGVPVTVDHPNDGGNFATANSPKTLSDWHVGRIFNAKVEDDALKAEAWINIKRADKVMPGLVDSLRGGELIDVSTGYFCNDVPEKGVAANGVEYEVISRNIMPDHLALLPGDEGACSWADGCGVRANRRKANMKLTEKRNQAVGVILAAMGVKDSDPKAADLKTKVNAALVKFVQNERGDDEDFRQMVADLISNDGSPFVPDDEESLRMMSLETLTKMRDAYKPEEEAEEVANEGEEDEEEPAANEGDEEETPEEKAAKKANSKKGIVTMKKTELDALVANAAKKAADAAVAAALSPTDKQALARANASLQEYKKGLVTKIVANSAITEAQCKGMDLPTLEAVANGIQPAPDYSGRATPHVNAEVDESLADLLPPSTKTVIMANRAGKGVH